MTSGAWSLNRCARYITRAPPRRSPASPGCNPAATRRCWLEPDLDCSTRCTSPDEVDRRWTSTRPNWSIARVIQARSSGRNPLFFWLPRQFFRSTSWCAMLTSPTRMTSRSTAALEVRRERVEKAELRLLPVLARRSTRKIAADDAEPRGAAVVEAGFDVAAFRVEFRIAEPATTRRPFQRRGRRPNSPSSRRSESARRDRRCSRIGRDSRPEP